MYSGFFLFIAGILCLLVGTSPAAALEITTLSLQSGGKPVRVFTQGPHALMKNAKGGIFRIALKDGKLVLSASAEKNLNNPRPKDILPDGAVIYGNKGIEAAWLTGATRRYNHAILGDGIEATGIAARLAGGALQELKLDQNSVFEDRLARLADLDGDGQDEIIAVRSYLEKGAALAVVKTEPQGLRIIAETRPIGIPQRWLNPVGVGDFDGDGSNEVALVKTPHIGGTLEIYGLVDSGLHLKGDIRSFSNHAIGERELGKSAVIDTNGDGVPEIILPDDAQRSLHVISFKGGTFSELGRINNQGAPIGTGLAVVDLDGDGNKEIVYGLSDWRVMAVFFKP
ncbi:MAG: VCBS repeat-containing protein [Proteobacteria bacterium]|nr:VCBS repeat-containing protein [Pseudomonadota bacterium]MDA1022547.1 VCBS repeat-containing protein [Pseudomonadota bacterium]